MISWMVMNSTIGQTNFFFTKMKINPKLQLLQLPLEIKYYTQRIINSHQFQLIIKHLESDLIFWFHDLDVDYDWWLSSQIHGFIDYPHPKREMKVPLYLSVPIPLGYRAIFLGDRYGGLTNYYEFPLEYV